MVDVVVKVAVTLLLLVNVTVHCSGLLATGVQPVHFVKVAPVSALAVSVTAVPLVNVLLQAVPQLIPTGSLVTVPLPLLLIDNL
ncbi:hypothetical protein CXB77_16755 [Chromatium okenii]|uniref:Uncharacterized protein n=1 Tax=Chromatium okenii TaxID=61644 RepID=A0A2S7XPQ1_9GAMM|nr:hypothetical protein CXB77_16755 [Chromatium okenii]